MTEVPDYLLERSKSRRRALGLLDDDGGGAADGGGGGAAAGGGGAAAGGPSPTTVAPIEPRELAPPPPEPAYVTAARTRNKPPAWISVPLVAGIAVWALIYVALLGESDAGAADPLELGAELYAANCASCHGAGGGGGVGQVLADGEVTETFPLLDEHFAFVRQGTIDGEPYGAESRPGGQRIGGGYNGTAMPGNWPNLTDAELYAVVRYEREGLAGEELEDDDLVDRETVYELLEGEDTVSEVLPDAAGSDSAES